MKIAVYGCGFIGKKTINYIGRSYIACIIDNNKKNEIYNEIKIISFDDYLKHYRQCFIIVAINDFEGICDQLMKNDIYYFSLVKELPSSFSGYGNGKFETDYWELIKKGTDFLGLNAFSLLLYILAKKNKKRAKIIPEDWENKRKLEWFILNTSIEYAPKNQIINTINDVDRINYYCKTPYFINAFTYLNTRIKQIDKRFEKLKNKYNGKRCFIVATGSSLKYTDLEKLIENKEFIISMNKIYKYAPNIMLDAYVCTDRKFIESETEVISQIKCKLRFINCYAENYWKQSKENDYKLRVIGGDSLGFSQDISKLVYAGYTVTNSCLQIAAYLGFNDIYLLGVDCNYEYGSKNNYAYLDNTKDYAPHNVNGMILGYKIAKEYAETTGVRIFNATRGGKLEIFERVDFDALFG